MKVSLLSTLNERALRVFTITSDSSRHEQVPLPSSLSAHCINTFTRRAHEQKSDESEEDQVSSFLQYQRYLRRRLAAINKSTSIHGHSQSYFSKQAWQKLLVLYKRNSLGSRWRFYRSESYSLTLHCKLTAHLSADVIHSKWFGQYEKLERHHG